MRFTRFDAQMLALLVAMTVVGLLTIASIAWSMTTLWRLLI